MPFVHIESYRPAMLDASTHCLPMPHPPRRCRSLRPAGAERVGVARGVKQGVFAFDGGGMCLLC